MKKGTMQLPAFILLLSLAALTGCTPPAAEVKQPLQGSPTAAETEHVQSGGTGNGSEGPITVRFEDNISGIRSMTEVLKIESRDLSGQSTEGGQITRYKAEDDTVVRYNVKFYGETGRSERDYFFVNDIIFYTDLQEEYSSPIYAKNSDVIYRFLEKGMIQNGIYYQYDSVDQAFLPSDINKIPYRSLGELDKEYSTAKRERTEGYSDYNILVMNGFILGGYYDNEWVAAEALYPGIAETETYKLYVDGQMKAVVTGQKCYLDEEAQVEAYVEFSETVGKIEAVNPIIAYSGNRNLTIERGTAIPTESKIYREALNDYLAAAELTGSFELTAVTKVDLDNDGQDEVFVQAYQLLEPEHLSTGIQYMRKMIDGKVTDIALPMVDAGHYVIHGFSDLNGDGTKEVLLSVMGTGYSGYLVCEYQNGEFTTIYQNGHVD